LCVQTKKRKENQPSITTTEREYRRWWQKGEERGGYKKTLQSSYLLS
jgi:hypothetical protein